MILTHYRIITIEHNNRCYFSLYIVEAECESPNPDPPPINTKNTITSQQIVIISVEQQNNPSSQFFFFFWGKPHFKIISELPLIEGLTNKLKKKKKKLGHLFNPQALIIIPQSQVYENKPKYHCPTPQTFMHVKVMYINNYKSVKKIVEGTKGQVSKKVVRSAEKKNQFTEFPIEKINKLVIVWFPRKLL